MKATNNKEYPLVVIKSPRSISFYDEHSQLIDKNGYVWFAKLGNSNLKIERLKSCGNIIFIKESGNLDSGLFVAQILDVSDSPFDGNYPNYYSDLPYKKSVWFRINNLHSYSMDKLDKNFVGSASGGNIKKILRSICPTFFIKCKTTTSV